MTEIARTRGRIVVVAIFATAPKVDLFRFFWRELKLCGVRVYEPQDFDEAIQLVANDILPYSLINDETDDFIVVGSDEGKSG